MPIQWIDGDVFIKPIERFSADLTLPGSKSLTNRYLTCLSLADGASELQEASPADDVSRMLQALNQLGVRTMQRSDRTTIDIDGAGRNGLGGLDAEIDVGPAGTTMRFLTALATLGYGVVRIDGSPRMRQRPIGPLAESLRRLGATIRFLDREGYPPIEIRGRGLAGGEVIISSTPSSQILSALLMVAPYAQQDVMIAIDEPPPSRPYLAMTIAVMRQLGVEVVEHEGARFIVAASQRYQAGVYSIEPDASGASYFWAAAAVTGGRAKVLGLRRSSAQGDVRFVEVLEQMGCKVISHADALEVVGPADGVLHGVNVDLNAMPDTVQTLAVLALFARGRTEIRNVANLRLKETDRLAALSSELTRLGAKVDVHRDGLTVFPADELNPAEIETYDDHRMAMSFAVAALARPGIVIRKGGCVSKSFPGFFDLLADAIKKSRA